MFRDLLGVTKGAYAEFKYLRKEVIDKPVAEINRVSDIRLSPEFRRQGRKIAEIRFLVSEAPQQAVLKPEAKDAHAEIRESDLFQRLRSHGIGPRLAVAWILQDEARARATVEHVEGLAKAGQVKKSTAGYLRSLFENGAEVGPSAFDAQMKAEATQAREAARQAKEQAQREEAEQRARKQADAEATDRAKQVLSTLPPEAWRVFAAEFLQGLGTGLKSWDDKAGKFRDPVESLQFKSWLLNKFKHIGQKQG